MKNEKYNIKLNPDTATAEEIKKANEKLQEHLLKTGEKLAAKRVGELIKKPETPQDAKKAASPVYGKLLKVNTEILGVLKRMQEDMIDEQDTSFKSESTEKPKSKNGDLYKQYGLAGMAAGKLTGGKFKAGSLDGLFGLVGGIASGGGLAGMAFKKLFGKRIESAKKLFQKNQKDLDKTKKDLDKTKKDLDKTKKDVKKTKQDIDKTKKDLDTEKKNRKTRSDKGEKRGSQKVDADKKTVDTQKSTPDKKKVDVDAPDKKLSQNKKLKPKKKFKTPDPKKLNQAVKGIPKKVLKKGGKTAVKAVAKGVARSIPVLGLAISAGFAINDGIYGWKNADQILDKPKESLTPYDKAGASAASMVSGVTMGLVDAKKVVDAGKGVKSTWSNTFGKGADAIDKFEELGIIERNRWGDSEILDWKRLRQLTPEAIQSIIDINDWDDVTLKALKSTKKYAERKQAAALKKMKELNISEDAIDGKIMSNLGDEIPHQTNSPAPTEKGSLPGLNKTPVANPKAHKGANKGSLTSTGDVKEYIKNNEGLRLEPYQDTLGYPTIGYGHLIKPGEEYLKNGISQEEADQMFEEDFKEHWAAAMKIPTFNEQPDQIQNVLADMTYNLGPKWWTKWPNTMRALQQFDHDKVASGIENSLYYTQVGKRSKQNVNIIRNVAENEQPYAKTRKPNNKTQVQDKIADATAEKTTEPSVPESNKLPKENAIAETSQNLTKQTVAYETGVKTRQTSNVTQSNINNLNNIVQDDYINDRPLEQFS